MNPSILDHWESGSPYDQYMGRWSRRIAPAFLAWLDLPVGGKWVDVGCGTGALCAAILDQCAPEEVIGIEPSSGFLEVAAKNLLGRATLQIGSAASLPLGDAVADGVVSALMLNFVPDLDAGLREMVRIAASGGTIAAYVWDYADKMELIRLFWDVAVSLDPAAGALHEGLRFPIGNPDALQVAFTRVGLTQVEVSAIDVTTLFTDFDDYWQPFLGGQGPAPAYVMALEEERRLLLRDALRVRLPHAADGTISLTARAWAVRGRKQGEVA